MHYLLPKLNAVYVEGTMMSETTSSNDLTALFIANAAQGRGQVEVSDRDYACILLPELDYEAQLFAIESLLKRNAQADARLRDSMVELEKHAAQLSGMNSDRAIDDWGMLFEVSIYQDAAHSMAAVGMLAPFIESIFFQTFFEIKKLSEFYPLDFSKHPRWKNYESAKHKYADDMDGWNCHCIWSKEGRRSKELVKGISDLSNAIGLDSYLPVGIIVKLDALFSYRNKMFHNGFEWPISEREKFAKTIKQKQWPSNWFCAATRGRKEKPWIHYMSDGFISECISLIDPLIKGIGRFAKDFHSERIGLPKTP